MATLHILSPSSVARTIELTERLITIGRTAENAICIEDVNISKEHGILVRDGDDYQLHDFKSTNGTFVNGERIMAVKLKDSAAIRLGSVELRYESGLAKETQVGGTQADQTLIRTPGGGTSKDRGMAKRVKPESAPGMLQPGSFAKPIPPAPNLTSKEKS
jgi:adenylate cyclase